MAGTRADVPARDNIVDLDVVADCAWTLGGIPNWIQADPASGGGSGTTRVRFRINANTSTSSRSAEITFTAGTARSSFTFIQEGAPSQITYVGGASTVSVSQAAACGPSTPPGAVRTLTLSGINVSVTVFGTNVTAGQVAVVETLATQPSGFPCSDGSNSSVLSLSGGSAPGNDLTASFSKGFYITQAELRASRAGSGFDGTITFNTSFGTVSARVNLQPR